MVCYSRCIEGESRCRVRAICSKPQSQSCAGVRPEPCHRKNQFQALAPGITTFRRQRPALDRCKAMSVDAGYSLIEKLASAKCQSLPRSSEGKPDPRLADRQDRLAIIDEWITGYQHRCSSSLSSSASSSLPISRWCPPQAAKQSPVLQRRDDAACRRRQEPTEETTRLPVNGLGLDDLAGGAEVVNGG
jgi:hypothetical protein